MGNMGKEFDFERNLALFDKRRVLEEIESNQPDVVRLIDHNRRGGSGNAKTKATASKIYTFMYFVFIFCLLITTR